MSGEFVNGALKLSGTVENAKEPTKIDVTGKLLDDGTMEGQIVMGTHHNLPWTAERLKERK